jgi:hypothetical protein
MPYVPLLLIINDSHVQTTFPRKTKTTSKERTLHIYVNALYNSLI